MYDLRVGDLICIIPKTKTWAWEVAHPGIRSVCNVGTEYCMIYLEYLANGIVHVLIGNAVYSLALDLFHEPTKIYRRDSE